MNNTALVRIKKEYDMMKNDPPENFIAYPIKDDLFTWHFTIRGADDTEFEGGLYHGVIKLPTSYPFKPPNIMFLTPSGRFDINIDVCLSVTKYHREEWQAAWTIRTMLEAIIAFFPIKEDNNAIGAIEYPTEARKKIAIQSRKLKCDICGPLIDILPEKKRKESTNSNNQNQTQTQNTTQNNLNSNNTNPTQTDKKEIASSGAKEKEIDNKSNKSDHSNPVIDSANTDGRPVKREKSKLKKIELDRKSHLSNIEGVIFEDVNEYAENEEEIELDLIKRHQTEYFDENLITEKLEGGKKNINGNNLNFQDKFEKNENNLTKNEPQIEMKRYNSDNTNNSTSDFGDYLRRLRQSQFEANNVGGTVNTSNSTLNVNQNLLNQSNNIQKDKIISPLKSSKTPTNTNSNKLISEDEPEINFKSTHHNNETEVTENNFILNPKEGEATRTQPQLQHHQHTQGNAALLSKSMNTFRDTTKDELDFYDIMSTVKFHKSKTGEEILQDLKGEKISNLINNQKMDKDAIIKNVLTKLIEKEINNANVGGVSQNQNHNINASLNSNSSFQKHQLKEMIELFSGKDKMENLLKQKSNVMKYMTRNAYKEAKTKRIRVINLVMVLMILSIFGLYAYFRSYA